MTGEPDLISLLHRADWTRLSLSAEVNDGSTLLIAPGRRYRVQTGEYVKGCDGDRPWMLSQHDVDGHEVDGTVHWISGPEPPLPTLLCPAWLLKSSRLEARGLPAHHLQSPAAHADRRGGHRGRDPAGPRPHPAADLPRRALSFWRRDGAARC
jgi:hypothetical protein